jgi:hypothetical protein
MMSLCDQSRLCVTMLSTRTRFALDQTLKLKIGLSISMTAWYSTEITTSWHHDLSDFTPDRHFAELGPLRTFPVTVAYIDKVE